MNAKTEREMLAWALTVDDQLFGTINDAIVAVARDVPHHHLVALADGLAADFDIAKRRAAHVRYRCLPADDFRNGAGQQFGIGLQLGELVRVLIKPVDAAGNGVPGGVVAANDQQQDVAEEFHERHVFCRLAMRQHRDQVMTRRLAGTFVPKILEVHRTADQFGAHLLLRHRLTHVIGSKV